MYLSFSIYRARAVQNNLIFFHCTQYRQLARPWGNIHWLLQGVIWIKTAHCPFNTDAWIDYLPIYCVLCSAVLTCSEPRPAKTEAFFVTDTNVIASCPCVFGINFLREYNSECLHSPLQDSSLSHTVVFIVSMFKWMESFMGAPAPLHASYFCSMCLLYFMGQGWQPPRGVMV